MDDLLHKLDWVLPLRNEFFTPLAEFFTALGYVPFFLLSLPILYWAWNKPAVNRITIVLLLSALLNTFLKDLFRDARPEEYFMEGHGEDSYGLPSGHTQLAIVFWYALAMEIRKRWFWVMASVFVTGIAFSRLYLGVHDLEDVIGGAILGFAALPLYGAFLRFRVHPMIVGVAAPAFALVLLLTWPNKIPVPDIAVLLGGYLLGWLIGIFLERNRCLFEKKPGAGKTALAVILGLAGIGGLAAGLSFSLNRLVDAGLLPDTVALMFAGGLVGLFIAFAAPCLFVKVNLMARTTGAG
jgi:membrane-associated phospholipid phosphatase